MASRSGRSGDYLLNDHHERRGSSCPQTWKFAVAVLLVCALFLIGVVIGYCISQSALGRRLDGSCDAVQQQARQTDTSDDSLESFSDPRQIKQRHWNLTSHLHTADYSLPADLMYATSLFYILLVININLANAVHTIIMIRKCLYTGLALCQG